ncbi:ATP-binding protein [Haloplasma contractile]|uniref:Circadian input-output histidine kinase CikA n=1 Tax=Haloplasma contractile SSD-17B TaxID=1033810 RepID=U2FL04_9MOLU|nr:ATP-binding protein [Haloplasma contractile]ERJ13455.1 two-component system chemotaxis family CheB-CheR fusion protein [Haloplasma contractile SSD-17B]
MTTLNQKNRSIIEKLQRYIFLIFSLPITLFIVFFIIYERNEEYVEAKEELRLIVRNQELLIKNHITTLEDNSNYITDLFPFDEYFNYGFSQIKTTDALILQKYIKQTQYKSNIYVFNANKEHVFSYGCLLPEKGSNQDVSNNCKFENTESITEMYGYYYRPQEILRETKSDHSTFNSIRPGIAMHTPETGVINAVQLDKENTKKINIVLSENDFSITIRAFLGDESDNVYTINRIYDRHTGKFIGLLVIEFMEDDLVESIIQKRITNHPTYFMEKKGRIVFTPHYNQALYKEIKQHIKNEESEGFMDYIDENKNGKLAYFKRLNSSTLNEYYIYSEVEFDHLYGSLFNKYILVISIIFGTFLLAYFGLRKFLITSVSVPLKDITRTIKNIGKDEMKDINKNILEMRFDSEINDLAKEVNQLNHDLIQYYEELDVEKEKAMQEAVSANNAKSIFLANMTHEMRTPLNSVIGYTQIINKIGFKNITQVEDYVNRINVSSEILLRKINDILDLSKIEAGQLELNKELAHLREIIHEVYDVLIFQAESKGIEFYFDIDQRIPEQLIFDHTRLKQILLNLCTNAIKFTETGSVSISAELFNHLGNELIIDWKVKDTGCGMPKDKLGGIFVPFTQVNQTDQKTGTGLGLAITKDLIELMGGSISVSSKVGVGTIFSFTTILNQVETVEEFQENRIPTKEVSQETVTKRLKDKKILVVEDNNINQVLIIEIFSLYNKSDIEIVNNGKEGLEACRNKQYDLIFMDIQMPVMNGIKATEEIRKLELYESTPIIALTANAFKNQLEVYIEDGMNECLAKPIEIERLEEILMRFL